MPSSQVTQQSSLVFSPLFSELLKSLDISFGGKLRDSVLSFGQILNITGWNVDLLKFTRCCSTYQQTHFHWYPSVKSLQWAWLAAWMWRLLRLRRMRRISDFNAFIMCSWCISTYQAHAHMNSAQCSNLGRSSWLRHLQMIHFYYSVDTWIHGWNVREPLRVLHPVVVSWL